MSRHAAPTWLKHLVNNVADVPGAYRRSVPADVLASITAANARRPRSTATIAMPRYWCCSRDRRIPRRAGFPTTRDLLVTVRAPTLRNHAGQAAFPGGAADPGDDGPVFTALREAREETGLDTSRLRPLATLDRMFIPPSGFHVIPVLAYSPDPGPVGVVNSGETAIVARVPVRAFINPDNRLMVYRQQNTRRFAGPAFLLNEMLVWGFTGQVISAMLDVAGWATPWNTVDVRELVLQEIALVDTTNGYREGQQ